MSIDHGARSATPIDLEKLDRAEMSATEAKACPARGHGRLLRGLDSLPGSSLDQGRFGRMFRRLPAYLPGDETIRAIAKIMADDLPETVQRDNPDIPAGYTYLGQFIDHDLTFDPVSSLDRQNDPDALVDFRSPRFDLDSMYGSGPADQPYLYDKKNPGRLLIGRHDDELDLPRTEQETAIIGDPRNDENILVSQIALTFMSFHNQVMDRLHEFPEAAPRDGETEFAAAQRVVRWHYQWVAVHDFLKRVVGQQTLDSVLKTNPVEHVDLRFFRWSREPFMPVEFSVAAYRLGHSMIRAGYQFNTTVPGLPIFVPGPIAEADPLSHMGGFRKLPALWQVEWRRFFEIDGQTFPGMQPSRALDTRIAVPLLDLPPDEAPIMTSLVMRNLTRGARLGLPSGQSVARAMGIRPLTDEQLALPKPGPAPLWYYVLREAEILGMGRHMGPVGGRIVAEVFLGLLSGDNASYLRMEPGWRPFLPSLVKGDFTMPDLIKFSGFGLAQV
ncbi:peroxidase [Pseudonocardiaceae bacterium YIM PH 21723]|nr:peroxidase [Pseudonocardiaceae bacterium YIM PH 21723]